MALHRAPGWGQRRTQPLARALEAGIVEGAAITQRGIDQAHLAQHLGVAGQGGGDHVRLAPLIELGALQRQALQLAVRLDLQMPGDIAGAVVIEREAAEQQHEQQTAEAEDPSGGGEVGAVHPRAGHGCEVLRSTYDIGMSRNFPGQKETMIALCQHRR